MFVLMIMMTFCFAFLILVRGNYFKFEKFFVYCISQINKNVSSHFTYKQNVRENTVQIERPSLLLRANILPELHLGVVDQHTQPF